MFRDQYAITGQANLARQDLGHTHLAPVLEWVLYCHYMMLDWAYLIQAMELIDDAGSPPNLLVHLDTYHMNIEESSSEFAVGVCADKLG